LGISRSVIERAKIPLLGVCLGHQALCHLAGGKVDLAPEPRHGLVSHVSHDGSGLFAGIPSPFPVVRYHSLAVRDVPDGLKATAWADDGVLMAVEDLSRPAWGVQFHPESIRTAYGRDLMANFLAQSPRAEARPIIDLVSLPASKKQPRLKVFVERLDLDVAPADAYQRLFARSRRSFWPR